jgi:hypothetical protein
MTLLLRKQNAQDRVEGREPFGWKDHDFAVLDDGSGIADADLQAAVAVPNSLAIERDRLVYRARELRTVTSLDQLRTPGQVLISEGLKYRGVYTCLAAEASVQPSFCGGKRRRNS